GSIWINAQAFQGSGSVSADGGAGEPPHGGGGAGGRIAITCTVKDFAGTISAHGAEGAEVGGAGTVYLSDGNHGLLLIENGERNGASTPVTITNDFDLTVAAGAVASFPLPVFVGDLLIESNATATAFAMLPADV